MHSIYAWTWRQFKSFLHVLEFRMLCFLQGNIKKLLNTLWFYVMINEFVHIFFLDKIFENDMNWTLAFVGGRETLVLSPGFWPPTTFLPQGRGSNPHPLALTLERRKSSWALEVRPPRKTNRPQTQLLEKWRWSETQPVVESTINQNFRKNQGMITCQLHQRKPLNLIINCQYQLRRWILIAVRWWNVPRWTHQKPLNTNLW